MSNKELISSRHLPQRLENLDFSEDLMDRVASLPNAEGLFDEIKNDEKCRAHTLNRASTKILLRLHIVQ